jgi:hypothetical protein
MSSMKIVVVKPSGKSAAALCGRGVGAPIGPFSEHGLDKAFGLSVCARPIGLGERLTDGEALADGPPRQGLEDLAVIGEKASGIDAAGLVPEDGPLEEGSGVFLVFGAERLDVAQAGMIVDADVDMFPARLAFLSPPVSRDPMADASDDAAQLLDVDVKQISGVGMFIAADRLWGRQCS